MVKHTPGPWKVSNQFNNSIHEDKSCAIQRDHPDDPQAYVIAEICGDVDEHRANARLIAAAPELLDIVKNYIELERNAHFEEFGNSGHEENTCNFCMAVKAYAKAEGRI